MRISANDYSYRQIAVCNLIQLLFKLGLDERACVQALNKNTGVEWNAVVL